MYRGYDNQSTSAIPQRDTVRKLPNRDRPPYVQNTSFPGMDPMKTDFSSIVQEFERLKLARGSQQHELATELPYTPARPISQVNTSQAQIPSHLEQNFGRDITSFRNLASDKMADFFPNASPTAIAGFVTELFAPKQSIFAIRHGLRAFGDPRIEIPFETVAQQLISIVYDANGITQPLVAASRVGATPNPFVSTPPVVTAPAAPQILTSPVASQVVAAPVVPQTVTAPVAPQMNTAPATPQTVTAPAAPQMAAAVPQTATAPGVPQSHIVPVVTALSASQAGAAPAANTATSQIAVTQPTTVPDDPDEASIESHSKFRRAEAKAGAIHYVNSSPQNPFKAQTIYQVLKRTHILTYYQSISASKIAKPEVATDNLMPGDLYIHYNSATGDSQANMQGQLWVWPKVPAMGWSNKTVAYAAQNETLHPVFDNMALYFSPSKAYEPNYYTKDYVKKQRVKEAGNQVMSASASSRSRG